MNDLILSMTLKLKASMNVYLINQNFIFYTSTIKLFFWKDILFGRSYKMSGSDY